MIRLLSRLGNCWVNQASSSPYGNLRRLLIVAELSLTRSPLGVAFSTEAAYPMHWLGQLIAILLVQAVSQALCHAGVEKGRLGTSSTVWIGHGAW